MKHIAHVSKTAPAMAVTTWDWANPDKGPGIANFNEMGSWVNWGMNLVSPVLTTKSTDNTPA